MPVAPAKYQIKVRDSNLVMQGEVDEYEVFEMIPRYNGYGSWQLTISDDHPMASLLATPGNGIYVNRNGAYFFSGFTRYVERDADDTKTLVLAGYDDNYLLATRLAWPVTNAPYQAFQAFNNVLRAYSFGDTSGTAAVDFGPFSQNGTYHATFALNQTALIDDEAASVLFSSNGYCSVPTASLPTGNSSFSMYVWFNYISAPGATSVVAFLGTASSASSAYIGILSTGKCTMQLKGANTNGSTTLTAGVHMLGLVYNGTTATMWLDGAIEATATPGTCTLAYGAASFGCYGAGASNFANLQMQYGLIFSNALGNASLPGSDLDGKNWMIVYYLQGLSRFAAQTYDTETGPAETVLKTYVDFNAGTDALSYRQFPHFSIETDAASGSTVTYDARFDSFITADFTGMFQTLAQQGGIGFRIVQIAGPLLQFQVFTPAMNNKAKFSKEIGNLASYSYINDAQQIVNSLTVAGGGTGTARTYLQVNDSTSQASWGRVEGLYNAGSSTDRTVLSQQGLASLANTASKLTFNGNLIEVDGLKFVTDFNLGDKVSVIVDGATLTDILRSVDIKLTGSASEDITLGIGTPASGQIVAAMQRYEQLAARLGSRVNFLERV